MAHLSDLIVDNFRVFNRIYPTTFFLQILFSAYTIFGELIVISMILSLTKEQNPYGICALSFTISCSLGFALQFAVVNNH